MKAPVNYNYHIVYMEIKSLHKQRCPSKYFGKSLKNAHNKLIIMPPAELWVWKGQQGFANLLRYAEFSYCLSEKLLTEGNLTFSCKQCIEYAEAGLEMEYLLKMLTGTLLNLRSLQYVYANNHWKVIHS